MQKRVELWPIAVGKNIIRLNVSKRFVIRHCTHLGHADDGVRTQRVADHVAVELRGEHRVLHVAAVAEDDAAGHQATEWTNGEKPLMA